MLSIIINDVYKQGNATVNDNRHMSIKLKKAKTLNGRET